MLDDDDDDDDYVDEGVGEVGGGVNEEGTASARDEVESSTRSQERERGERDNARDLPREKSGALGHLVSAGPLRRKKATTTTYL
ncbi:hypothetical protein ACHAXA_007721 [Cyclostephanos tholiformis]|uniref:Uncharacterized protein n=1 Tax=Cyclostephanos tholiformis TaxID=382380 RepID=A0ABD3RY53_9STRA